MVLRHHICTQCDGWKRPLHSSNLAMDWLDCLIGPHGTISHSYWLVKLSNWSTCFVINNLLLFKVALSSLWVELRIYEYVIINPKIWNKPRYLSKKRKFNFNTFIEQNQITSSKGNMSYQFSTSSTPLFIAWILHKFIQNVIQNQY